MQPVRPPYRFLKSIIISNVHTKQKFETYQEKFTRFFEIEISNFDILLSILVIYLN